jgi:TetR/AcrR family transcriptional repressor of nem operon
VKVSKAMAAQHREALLTAACRLFREKGFDKVGIAEIAAAAGLTHGAFYTHFSSKEALCIEAITAMVRRTVEGLKTAPALDVYFDAYLSPLHVLARGEGCPFAALGGDAVRQSEAIRTSFSRGVEQLIDAFTQAAGSDDEPDSPARRARAINSLALLIGGLTLARSAASEGLRDEILSALRAGVLDSS